jgi:hypothetical protein
MATYTVRTPEPDYTGMVGNIAFNGGVATVEGNLQIVDGVPVLDQDTAPVEFHHMVKVGYIIEPVPAAKKTAPSKESQS